MRVCKTRDVPETQTSQRLRWILLWREDHDGSVSASGDADDTELSLSGPQIRRSPADSTGHKHRPEQPPKHTHTHTRHEHFIPNLFKHLQQMQFLISWQNQCLTYSMKMCILNILNTFRYSVDMSCVWMWWHRRVWVSCGKCRTGDIWPWRTERTHGVKSQQPVCFTMVTHSGKTWASKTAKKSQGHRIYWLT